MRVAALVVTALVAGGCRFGGDADGTGFRCDDQHGCPDRQSCIDGWCRSGAPADASAVDASGSDGLVAWYRMEAAGVTSAVDEVGGHDGTCEPERCPAPVVGKIDGAFEFDGMDDRFRIADDEDFRLSDGTAMAWVYYTGTLTGAVIGKPYGPADNDAWLLFVDPEGGGLATVGFESAGEVSRSNTMFDMERWTHVAITWTPSR